MNLDLIPAEMRAAPRWLVWRMLDDRKVPFDFRTGRAANGGVNTHLLCTFEEARAALAAGGYTGLGFALGDGWAGLDFDDCIVNGTIEPWIETLVGVFKSYAEISPSGSGIKVFLRATLPDGSRTGKRHGIEIYDRDRWFAVTGRLLPGSVAEVPNDKESLFRELHSVVFGYDLLKILRLQKRIISEAGNRIDIRCPWADEHTGTDGPRDAGLLLKDGKIVGFHCFHAHCADKKLPDVRKFFGVLRASDEHLLRINERHALVSIGNKRVVMEFGDEREIVELWPFEEFKKKLIKEPTIKLGKKRVALSDYWLRHPDGRSYDRLIYAMPGSAERLRAGDYNGYQGFTITPAPGDWSKNREHLFRIVCGGNETLFAFLINWLAALFQLPGRHAWTSLVLRGMPGTGKGHFADFMIGKCFHRQQYLHLIGANQLTGEYNEHFSGKVFVFADETIWGGDKQAAQKLKGMITEDEIPIHRKFLKIVNEPSALHTVIASNSEWPVAIEPGDRRFAVYDVLDEYRNDQDYFTALRDEFEHGGRAAMIFDLLAHSIEDALLRTPPDSDAKRDVKERTLSPDESWIQTWLMDLDGLWTERQAKAELYDRYTRELPRPGFPRPAAAFGKLFKKVGIEWHDSKVDSPAGKRVNAYEFPSLATCRAEFDKTLGLLTEWPADLDDESEGKEPSNVPF
jgi:hypothetical protein